MARSGIAHEIHGTFISEKVNKIRWRPDVFNDSNQFVTGSWDNLFNNYLTLWGFQENEHENGISPYVISNELIEGDCTEIKFLNPNYFLSSTSSGDVSLYEINTNELDSVSLKCLVNWKNAHRYFLDAGDEVEIEGNCSCTSLAVYDKDACSVGEDGRINFFNLNRKEIINTVNNGDSCVINCVSFLKVNEVLTGNSRGLMKIWDCRDLKKPSAKFNLSNDSQVNATCIAQHPTQKHMIIAGDKEGALTVWDLRQNTFPVNLLSAHSEQVSEIAFHSDYPDLLCSCSYSGELWLWKSLTTSSKSLPSLLSSVETSPWFSTESAKNKLEIFWLMPRVCTPVNSLDMNRNRVLCGCDNEEMYLINEINMLA